jgi:hypothetical protein
VIVLLPGQAAGPWTAAQVHDTVAAIAAQRIYAESDRFSLLGRLFRFLWDRFVDLLEIFEGTLDPRILLYAGIGIVAVVIVARIVIAQRLADGANQRRGRAGPRLDGRTDYWALARDQAAAGRYDDACHLVYAAVIDGLSRRGLVTYHSSKTSGDYARDLRRTAAPLHADFRSFARQFDRVIFRESSVGAVDYEQLREFAERASRASAVA